MTAASSGAVTDGVEVAGLAADRRQEGLGALDRRLGRHRVDGEEHEVLAGVDLEEAGVPGLTQRQLRCALEAEVGLRVGVGQVVGDLPRLEQHVQWDDHGAGLEDAVVDDREVRGVGAAESDLVALLDTPRDQEVGHHVRQHVDLGVGHPAVAQDDGVAVGVAAG